MNVADDERRPAADEPPVLPAGLLAFARPDRRRQRLDVVDGISTSTPGVEITSLGRGVDFVALAHRVASSRTRGFRKAMSRSASSVDTM